MTGTTLELIFSGLMILSLPEGDGKAVVVFPDDPRHQLHVALLKGTATCNGEDITGSLDQFLEGPQRVLRLDYPHCQSDLSWIGGGAGPVPSSTSEASYLSWLPSLTTMVAGDSRLRNPCRDPSAPCPGATARFILDRGHISSCHLVHDPLSENTVELYQLAKQSPRALADAIVVRETVEVTNEEGLSLTLPGVICNLKADSRNEIVLILSNAPRNSQTTHSHFSLLHRFHRNPWQRMDRSRPKRIGPHPILAKDFLGSCEGALHDAQELLYPGTHRASGSATEGAFFVIHSPNSPTECGTASQP